MYKERSDAASAGIFDGPFLPFFSIVSTNASCGAACVEHSWTSGVFRHEAPVNVRVFLHEPLYTIPQSAPFYKKLKNVSCEYLIKMTSIYLRVDRSCITGTRL